MSLFILELQIHYGAGINEAIDEAIELAKRIGVTVNFVCNRVNVRVTSESNAKEVLESYLLDQKLKDFVDS